VDGAVAMLSAAAAAAAATVTGPPTPPRTTASAASFPTEATLSAAPRADAHVVAASSSPVAPATTSAAARQFPLHVLDAPRCLRERGFAFVPTFGEAFAREYIAQMGEDIATRKKQRIVGEVEQFAMPQSGASPWPTKLRALWHALVALLVQHAGVDPQQLQLLVNGRVPPTEAAGARKGDQPLQLVQDEKLLIAGRQKGEQAPHFDRDDSADKLKQVYTIILYLTDGVDSTAFPQFPLDEFAVPEFDAHDVVQNAAAMRATVERGCLNKERYDRWPVRVGDMALFTQATMHFGTKNNILHERIALFSVLTPFDEKRQDDYQIYSWLYVGFAYGEQSRESAEALWQARDFEPLQRFSANASGRRSHEAYISCLLRWGYIRWNPHARKNQPLRWTADSERRPSPLSQDAVARLFYGEEA